MKAKILVADGCDFVAHTVGQLATRFGYDVTACVSTGVEALQSLRHDPPDLALVDLHMGGEVSGTAVASALVEAGCPVVFMSALPDDRSYDLASRFGASGVLPKPFGTSEFRREVRNALPSVAESLEMAGA